MAKKITESQVPPFGIRDKLGYMFGDFGYDFTFILSSSFMLKFYTDVMGIDAAVVGLQDAVGDGALLGLGLVQARGPLILLRDQGRAVQQVYAGIVQFDHRDSPLMKFSRELFFYGQIVSSQYKLVKFMFFI